MTAEQIVRALAAADPSHSSERGTLHRCTFCQKTNDWPRVLENAADHESDCPWRLAVEWVAARDHLSQQVADGQFYAAVCPQGKHLNDAAAQELGRDVFDGLRVLGAAGGDVFNIMRGKQ